MATFPNYSPTYGATKELEPEFRTVRFGDGYEHRFIFGLNPNVRIWNLVFEVSNTEADEIEGFLYQRVLDQESFDWAPPTSQTEYKWVCESRTRELYAPNRSRLSLTFREVFEP